MKTYTVIASIQPTQWLEILTFMCMSEAQECHAYPLYEYDNNTKTASTRKTYH